MALVKNILEQQIKEIFETASIAAVKSMLAKMKDIELSYSATGELTGAIAPTDEQIAKEFTDNFVSGTASQLATVIDTYIKSATIVTNPGQLVNVTGTAIAQIGATTSTGTAVIT
jgi:hypothetical protein